ncbi:hypothetical protein GUITHDRAFT_100336 [Guillardia theta CCMP2712]|uniref:Uncharacterized protein n=1 Tax=Guillardia theta (strain CCMP2712) TaxID=905079 RepID=L1K132_GUITC|nr:hypothetical protein GUITHDRAFT_100336 [Guillardia theta CCMP2712]EKX54088.1 hypothetical protein GUITHDRAFT_100336 [Guillardia theta CCMP2712]|eukprot:XP_005841068.1 hypothetical protein GUITHDRAFT_100336 [Guillardia theta CCMP2712]
MSRNTGTNFEMQEQGVEEGMSIVTNPKETLYESPGMLKKIDVRFCNMFLVCCLCFIGGCMLTFSLTYVWHLNNPIRSAAPASPECTIKLCKTLICSGSNSIKAVCGKDLCYQS